MSTATGLYRTTHTSGAEIVFVDKGLGAPLSITRERYEECGYEPPFDKLPQK